jgi:adhesin transport system outer membrane protein
MTSTILYAQALEPSLPPPSGAPQLVVAGDDPLIRYLESDGSGGSEAFLSLIARSAEDYPTVREALASEDEVRQDRVDAKSALLPQVDLNLSSDGSLVRHFAQGSTNVIEKAQPISRVDAMLSGQQLLYDFGATSSRIKAANAHIRAQGFVAEDAAGTAAINAIAAYYEVFTDQTLVALARSFVERSRNILNDTRLRFEQGYGPGGDVVRAEGQVANAESLAASLDRQLADAKFRFTETTGALPSDHLQRPERPHILIASRDLALLDSHNVPVVAAASSQVKAFEQEAKAAHADRLPRISAVVTAARYDVFGPSNDYDVRGQITLGQHLFGKGANSAETGRARARLDHARFALDQAVSQAERDAGIAFEDLQALKVQEETQERTYIASRRTRDLMVEQQKVSRGNFMDMLRAERDYFDAASALVHTSSESDLTRYLLLLKTGGLLRYFNVSLPQSAIDDPRRRANLPGDHDAGASHDNTRNVP